MYSLTPAFSLQRVSSDIGSEDDEESEDDGEEDVDQFDRYTGNMDEHEEMQNGIYVSPLSPLPARAQITAGDLLGQRPTLGRRERVTPRDSLISSEVQRGCRLQSPISLIGTDHRHHR